MMLTALIQCERLPLPFLLRLNYITVDVAFVRYMRFQRADGSPCETLFRSPISLGFYNIMSRHTTIPPLTPRSSPRHEHLRDLRPTMNDVIEQRMVIQSGGIGNLTGHRSTFRRGLLITTGRFAGTAVSLNVIDRVFMRRNYGSPRRPRCSISIMLSPCLTLACLLSRRLPRREAGDGRRLLDKEPGQDRREFGYGKFNICYHGS